MEAIQDTLPPPLDLDDDRIVKAKCELTKEKGEPRINLLRRYRSINQQLYDSLKNRLVDLLKTAKEGTSTNIDEFLPLIFGMLEGSSGTVDSMLLLTEIFGAEIENTKIEDIIKERTKVLDYGVVKRKEMSVREVDKKGLDSMAELFDVKQIKSHRKLCQSIRNYIKCYKKFTSSVDNSSEPITKTSQAYKNYVDFMKEELDFSILRIPTEEAMMQPEIKEEEAGADLTPLKEKKQEKKEQTASTKKNKDEENQNGSDENRGNKQTRIRRTKEEVEREKILREQQREAKKKQKEEKDKAKQLEKQREKAEKAEKERQKQLQKERQRQLKQEEKQAKEREKQKEKEAKQKQKEEKQAEKRRLQEQKQKKSNPGPSLYTWFKPKAEGGSPDKPQTMKDESQQRSQSSEDTEKENFLEQIRSQTMPLSSCREDFICGKMKDESNRFEPYYVNIVTHKSRLEFTNFLVTEERCRNYTIPHEQTDIGKYEDSSAEYEDLCGDMCSDEMSAEQDASEEENSAIVPDTFFEAGELSDQESKDDVVINIDKGGEWSFSSPDHEKAACFQIYCLYDDALPLTLSQPEQSNELPINLKCDLYREIHGFYGTKESLIRALAAIADMPRSYLDNLIKETTMKKCNQRVIKPEIVEYLNELKEGFSKELQEIKAKRDEEILSTVREKVNQKEKQIERLILEEAPTYYIVDLLQFLREKGFKIRKNYLSNFIDSKVGPQWNQIRLQMKKMKTESEKMNKFLGKKDKQGNEQNKESEESDADANKMQPQ